MYIMVSQGVFQGPTGENLMVQGQGCRLSGITLSIQILWLPHWCTHLLVALHVADEQHQFILWDKLYKDEHSDIAFQYSIQSSLLSHLTRSLQENNTFLIPEGCSHGFFLLMAQSWISSSLGIVCGAIESNATWIWVYLGGPKFYPAWQCTARRSYFHCHFVYSCQHSWHPVSIDLGIADLGPPLWTHMKVAFDGMAPHDFPNEEETQECAVSW